MATSTDAAGPDLEGQDMSGPMTGDEGIEYCMCMLQKRKERGAENVQTLCIKQILRSPTRNDT